MSGARSSTGREFQTDGLATEKARRPYVLIRCRGTTNMPSKMTADTDHSVVNSFKLKYCAELVNSTIDPFAMLTKTLFLKLCIFQIAG